MRPAERLVNDVFTGAARAADTETLRPKGLTRKVEPMALARNGGRDHQRRSPRLCAGAGAGCGAGRHRGGRVAGALAHALWIEQLAADEHVQGIRGAGAELVELSKAKNVERARVLEGVGLTGSQLTITYIRDHNYGESQMRIIFLALAASAAIVTGASAQDTSIVGTNLIERCERIMRDGKLVGESCIDLSNDFAQRKTLSVIERTHPDDTGKNLN